MLVSKGYPTLIQRGSNFSPSENKFQHIPGSKHLIRSAKLFIGCDMSYGPRDGTQVAQKTVCTPLGGTAAAISSRRLWKSPLCRSAGVGWCAQTARRSSLSRRTGEGTAADGAEGSD